MQMNRVKFNEGNPEKVNSQLTIEQVIYADRFLLEHREESTKLRSFV